MRIISSPSAINAYKNLTYALCHRAKASLSVVDIYALVKCPLTGTTKKKSRTPIRFGIHLDNFITNFKRLNLFDYPRHCPTKCPSIWCRSISWCMLWLGGWCWWWGNRLVAGAVASKSFAGLTNRRCQGRTLPPSSLFRTCPFRNSTWLHCLSNSNPITGSNAFMQ